MGAKKGGKRGRGPPKKEKWECTDDEKVQFGGEEKEKGNAAFKEGNLGEAIYLYNEV